MTNPPACVESPYGGCQDGPLGNGSGGSWSTTSDVTAEFYEVRNGGISIEGQWEFRRWDGQAPTMSDSERLRSALPGLGACIPTGLSLLCSD